jgi:hypothetical protein
MSYNCMATFTLRDPQNTVESSAEPVSHKMFAFIHFSSMYTRGMLASLNISGGKL